MRGASVSVSGDEQVVELIHDEFFDAFHCIVKLDVGRASPNICFSHFCGDELEKRHD